MRILLSGSSGFIGIALLAFLKAQGHKVISLERGSPRKTIRSAIYWNPQKKQCNLQQFEGFDAVIHLAGEPIVGFWTKTKKSRILLSRTVSAALLAEIFLQTKKTPEVFISASAVGYYGDRKEALLSEKSYSGSGFLAFVCREWEKASSSLAQKGVRVVHTRFGMVIGRGGVLQKMLPLFKLGFGGKLGSGNQWISWIAIDDLVRAIDFILKISAISGAVNFVAPHPVRQKDFAVALSKELHRPYWFHQSAWWLRLIFGQMAEELFLNSVRAFPQKLVAAHFSFHISNIQEALKKYV